MSGLEAAAAVSGLIGFAIAVIQGSIQIYGAVKDKSGIPERLRKVSDTLPSLLEVLEGAKAQFDKDHPPKQAWVEVEKDVQRCHAACRELHEILESAYPKDDAGTTRRVCKNIGSLINRKSKTAEELLKDIHGYLEILKQRQIITNTEKLDDIKKTIDELFPTSGIIQNTNSGINVGHNNGQINNQSGGSGNQFNGSNGNFTFNNTQMPKELNTDYVRMKLQEWLRFPSIDDRRSDITKAHRDTFQWVLSPPLLQEDPDILPTFSTAGSDSLPTQSIAGPDFSPTPSVEDFISSPTWSMWDPEYWPTPSMEDSIAWSTPSMQDFESSGSDFVEWLQTGSGVYWIQGKMGCGKSTLMKYVTEQELTKGYLREWANGQTLHCPSYYFSKIGTSELQRSLQGLYRTLLATLLQHEGDMVRVAFPTWQISDSQHPPTSALLRDALEKVLAYSGFSCKYCLFIDGLDEYQESDDALRGELARGLLELAQLPSVKLVVSSRPENMFKLKFAKCPTMKLHDLTRNDITAYVDAEIRRKALPHVLTFIETAQLNSLCNEVIWKAKGVFLWVTIAVASILNGIADYEDISELRSRIELLDPRLKVLFKQILTDRIQPSHRKMVARTLLMEGPLRCRKNHMFPLRSSAETVIQAISPHVDASYDYGLLPNQRKIAAHISSLQRRIPGRSCGLYNPPPAWAFQISYAPLNLSHASLHEFLNEHEIQNLLLEQAGDKFQVDEAFAVGRIAGLLYYMDVEHDRTFRSEDYCTKELIDIIHSIETAEISTGLTQTKMLSLVDELIGRFIRSGTPPTARFWKTDWDPVKTTYSPQNPLEPWCTPTPAVLLGVPAHGPNLLSITLSFGFSCYLRHKINTCRCLPLKTGTPLLFYPLWTKTKFLGWLREDPSYGKFRGEQAEEECHPNLVKLLLAAGADPNEYYHGRTPWSVVLDGICSGEDDGFPLHESRFGPPASVTWSKKSFLDKLEVAKLMLEHGADPFLSMKIGDRRLGRFAFRYTISPQIFAELLERQCCSGNTLSDCLCAYASQVQPPLTELAGLVKVRRYQKQQMRTEGDLRVQVALLALVLAYILQSFLISSS